MQQLALGDLPHMQRCAVKVKVPGIEVAICFSAPHQAGLSSSDSCAYRRGLLQDSLQPRVCVDMF